MKLSSLSSRVVILLVLSTVASLRAQVGNNNPTGPTGEFNGDVTTGCHYDPYTGNATRTVTDIVVAGAVGKYGLSYSRTWYSRSGKPGWSNQFSWWIVPLRHYSPSAQTLTYGVGFPDGHIVTFTGAYSATPIQGPPGTGVRFQTPYGADEYCYLILPDGGKIQFSVTKTFYNDPELIPPTWCSYDFTLTAIIDPYGQRTIITKNADGSVQITEPGSRWIKISPVVSGIQTLTASDGRQVTYTYQTQPVSPGTTPYTFLKYVDYYGDPSLRATYTYQVPNVGSVNGAPLLKTCDDPMYAGPMKRIGYVFATGNNADNTAAVVGQILSENYYDGINPNNLGPAVSTLSVNGTSRTENCPGGKTRTFTYDGSARLTGATDFKPLHIAQTQTYDASWYVNAVTDRNLHTTNFTNNSLTGAVTQVQYPSTPGDTPPNTPRGTITYTYGWAQCPDVNNRDANYPYYLYSVTDEGGNVTRFTRDTSKRITRVDFPNGGYETFTYNSFGQVLSHLMKTGGTETFTYDARGLKLTYRDPYHATGNPTAWYQYDALDRVSGVTDALGSASGDVNHTIGYAYNTPGASDYDYTSDRSDRQRAPHHSENIQFQR